MESLNSRATGGGLQHYDDDDNVASDHVHAVPGVGGGMVRGHGVMVSIAVSHLSHPAHAPGWHPIDQGVTLGVLLVHPAAAVVIRRSVAVETLRLLPKDES